MTCEKTELVKDGVTQIILDTKNILIDFLDRTKEQRADLPDIQVIRRRLEDIRKELGEVNIVITRICALYEELHEYLISQQEELESNNITIIDAHKNQLMLLIKENLPDDLNIESNNKDGDSWNIVYSTAVSEEVNKRRKKSEKIPFYEKESKGIGEILLDKSQNNLILKVKMWNETEYNEFIVDSSLRIYPIINHINTKYNYNEDK